MKRIVLILFIMMMSAAAFAQKLTVVVGAVGEEPKPGLRKALETQIKAAFVKDGRFTAVTREEAVLGAVDSEQAHQRTGAVDDNQIKQIGKQTGARYVCVVEIAPLMNSYTLNAQFVDIVSANIVSIASVPSQLRSSGDFLTASEELVRRLLGYAEAPAAAKKVPIKYIAVIETQIDTQAIAAKDISLPELREITSVLRREAVNNLPRDRFNVMTSETVQSMGTAVAEDCADETCIITLGSKIGADYIVRGTLSKLRGRFSLTIEIFETEYGNLMAVTPDPIRTADLDELIDKSAVGSAAMYKNFAGTGAAAAPPAATVTQAPAAEPAAPAPPAAPPPVTYKLTVSVNPSTVVGKVEIAPNLSSYNPGAKVTAVAVPTSGYMFAGWLGASTSTSRTITVTMNRNETLTANFKPIPTYTLNANASPPAGGKVVRAPNLLRYDTTMIVTVTAVPAEGYRFDSWSGVPGLTTIKTLHTETAKIYMKDNLEVTANFRPISPPKSPVVIATRWSGLALTAVGFISGAAVNESVDKQFEIFKDPTSTYGKAEEAKNMIERNKNIRNAFYVLGGLGLSAFTATLFF